MYVRVLKVVKIPQWGGANSEPLASEDERGSMRTWAHGTCRTLPLRSNGSRPRFPEVYLHYGTFCFWNLSLSVSTPQMVHSLLASQEPSTSFFLRDLGDIDSLK